jgi:DNA-directed RNA polymerase subunit M/transcription elongation factor TFIIS
LSTFQASECPECGSVKTYIVNVGHDEDGRTIRSRKCDQCSTVFGTVEIVLPSNFSFSKTDTYKRGRDRKKRVAYYSADRIVVGWVRIIKGVRTRYCAKGIHLLEGDNLDVRGGQRHCKACGLEQQRRYRARNRVEINRKAREYYHRKQAERETHVTV